MLVLLSLVGMHIVLVLSSRWNHLWTAPILFYVRNPEQQGVNVFQNVRALEYLARKAKVHASRFPSHITIFEADLTNTRNLVFSELSLETCWLRSSRVQALYIQTHVKDWLWILAPGLVFIWRAYLPRKSKNWSPYQVRSEISKERRFMAGRTPPLHGFIETDESSKRDSM